MKWEIKAIAVTLFVLKTHRCNQKAAAAFLLHFQSSLAVFLDFNSFSNILRPEFSMCSTHVCGILCGQRQSLAGAIPAGLCGILGSLLFHSVNNTKTAPSPRAVGCNQRVWAVRNSSVDISTTMWYSLTVEISTKAFVREERSHAGAI